MDSEAEAVLHAYPTTFFDHIETWWGSNLDDELMERMATAPEKHKQAFSDSLLPFWANISLYGLPEISPGVLRPALATNEAEAPSTRRIEGLRLLLYAHEIVLDPLDLFGDLMFGLDEGDTYASSFKQLAKMRPLIESGDIRFASTRGMGNHDPALLHEVYKHMKQPDIAANLEPLRAELDETFGDNWADLGHGDKLRDYIWFECGGIAAVCHLAAEHKAHILARRGLDQMIVDTLLKRPVVDNRQLVLKKLAALKVPTLAGDIGSLVDLRRSDADFAEWRTRLGDALSYVGELAEDEESLDEAAEVVHAQLSDGLSQVEKAVKKSPALRAARGGLTGFAVNGITAMTTELALGNPSVGLVAAASAAGAGAGMVVDSGVSYLKALQERRKGKLIMDVSMMFDPDGSMPDQLARFSAPLE
jgi:hypothetical protein